MKKLLLAPLGLLALAHSFGQDSTAAVYINDYIEKIEARLTSDILEKKDTIIVYEDTSGKVPLKVQTQFYTNPETMQVDKIIEKSTYNNLVTELTVYFRFNQAIRVTTTQKEGLAVKADFDVYFVNNNSVHFTKRTQMKGKPDTDEIIEWCKELLKDYDEIALEQKQNYTPPEPQKSKGKFIFSKKKKSG